MKIESIQDNNEKIVEKYNNSSKLFIKHFKSMINAVKQSNKNIRENVTTLTSQQETIKKLDSIKQEITNYDLLAKKYREFEHETEDLIPELESKYNQAWKESEKMWYNWDINKIVGWFEYILNGNCIAIDINSKRRNDDIDVHADGNINSNDDRDLANVNRNDQDYDINFDKIRENLTNEKFKAKYLPTIECCDLKEYGFNNDSICETLYQTITNLCEKYPKPRPKQESKRTYNYNKNKNNNNNSINIKMEKDNKDEMKDDSKQSSRWIGNENNDNDNDNGDDKQQGPLCSLSQQPMSNPVVAFDGQTYDKENIINYWKKHGTSPKNGRKVSNIDLAIADLVENKALKQGSLIKSEMNNCGTYNYDDKEMQDIDVENINSIQDQGL